MAYRYRLYPTKEQEKMFHMHCDHARLVWNVALEQFNLAPQFGQRCDIYAWGQNLTEARNSISWLKVGSSVVQQCALRDLQQALKNWWSNPSHFGRPTWRKAEVNEGFVIRDVKIRKLSSKWAETLIPKLGYVKFRLSRPLLEKYGHGRVTLDRSGRWHVSFTAPQPEVDRVSSGSSVGIDIGVTHTLTLSSGEHLDMPTLLSAGESQRLKRLQRKLSRQTKGSNRRNKTKLSIAKIRAKETDRRKDWVEKTTTCLVKQYDAIMIEDLDIKKMTKSAKGSIEEPGKNVTLKKNLNRSILNNGWGIFRLRLEQKAAATPEGNRCTVTRVNPAYTSQQCSGCGHIAKENRDNQATFNCKSCNHKENADVNAAKNILAAGLAVTGRGGKMHKQPDETLISSRKEKL